MRGITRGAFLVGTAALLTAGLDATRLSDTTAMPPPGPHSHAGRSPSVRIDHGIVLRPGEGPGGCDQYGAREASVFTDGTRLYMHYDGAGPGGWVACLASSSDGLTWTKHGPVLGLGAPGKPDSASASSPWVVQSGGRWFMFYLGTPHATAAPNRIPLPPYLTCFAESDSPTGPWRKRYDVTPFHTRPGSFYATTASPGAVIRHDGEWLQFFSGSAQVRGGLRRTVGLARTRNLAGPWRVDPVPLLPTGTDVENTSVYYEPADGGWWWLFTNHISEQSPAHTDSAVAFWSRNPTRWDPAHRMTVVDGATCSWSHRIVGMPTVLPVGGRLAVYFDGLRGDAVSHMGRDIGMVSLSLPLLPPR